ncbi:MAG: Gfo/Idh/MocA family oxidoreductase [Clostridiaceae bacterium]|nr:Gfo/Idh/MocA family oxidoreductase [Clostridiaceae bacterium]
MKKIRFAVVGIGRMGSVHAAHLLRGRVRGAELVAVADISLAARERFSKKCAGRVQVFSSCEELAAAVELDAVIIAVPHYAHVPLALYFLERGVSVLIEKPVAVTVSEAERLNAYLNANPEAVAAVMYNQRTNPVYRKAKALTDGGALGSVRRINFIVTDWYRPQAYYNQGEWRASYAGEGGGVLINQCVHQLDILQWLTGMPAAIYAQTASVGRRITVENDVTAVLRYEDGARCSLSASAHELNGANRIEIAGDRGRLVIGKYRMTHYSWDKSEEEVNEKTVKGYGGAKKRKRHYFYGSARLVSDLVFGQQIRIVKNFVNRLVCGEPLISPAAEGIRALTLINGIYLSAWEGREITLPMDSARYDALLEEKAEAERIRLDNTKKEGI